MSNIEGTIAPQQRLDGSVSAQIGLTPDIRVGTTTTLDGGTEAYVELDENSTKLNPIFNFGVPKGKDYKITKEDYEEIEEQVKEDIQPILEEIENTSNRAEIIAKGRATGYVFDTLEDLEAWLLVEENTSKLVLGDNLYIRVVGVPDYWWDGSTKQVLETQKVDLTEYAKTQDLPKVNYTYGIYKTSGGILYIDKATQNAIENKKDNYHPIVPANLDYAVKSVVGGHVTLTQAEYDALETIDENTYYYIEEE